MNSARISGDFPISLYIPRVQRYHRSSTIMEAPPSTDPFKAQIITHLLAEREHDQRSAIHAINPVDESENFKELCEACRRCEFPCMSEGGSKLTPLVTAGMLAQSST